MFSVIPPQKWGRSRPSKLLNQYWFCSERLTFKLKTTQETVVTFLNSLLSLRPPQPLGYHMLVGVYPHKNGVTPPQKWGFGW